MPSLARIFEYQYQLFLKFYVIKRSTPNQNKANYHAEKFANLTANLSILLFLQKDKVRRQAWSPLLAISRVFSSNLAFFFF